MLWKRRKELTEPRRLEAQDWEVAGLSNENIRSNEKSNYEAVKSQVSSLLQETCDRYSPSQESGGVLS